MLRGFASAPIRTSTPAIASSIPSTGARRRLRRRALISTARSGSPGSTTAGTTILAGDKAACLASRRPGEQLLRRQPMTPRDTTDRLAPAVTLGEDRCFLGGRPSSPPTGTREHFHPPDRLRHMLML